MGTGNICPQTILVAGAAVSFSLGIITGVILAYGCRDRGHTPRWIQHTCIWSFTALFILAAISLLILPDLYVRFNPTERAVLAIIDVSFAAFLSCLRETKDGKFRWRT